MPTFIDFHSMGTFSEDDLQKFQLEPRDEHGVKTLNIFYDLESGMMFCLLEAPDKKAVELHHLKIRIKCDWITQIKMTGDFQVSHEQNDSFRP
jgi:hypothetical protein